MDNIAFRMHNKPPDLEIGQPVGRIAQLSSVVPDLSRAIKEHSQTMPVGPWFVLERIPITGGLYRDKPVEVNVSVAIAYCGALQIELIQENSSEPSIFNEAIRSSGYGVHHYGVLTKSFDTDRAKYIELGYREVFYAVNEFPARNLYFDTQGALPVLLELIEITAPVEQLFAHMYAQALRPNTAGTVRRVTSLQDMFAL